MKTTLCILTLLIVFRAAHGQSINTYSPVIELSTCLNIIQVEDATSFNLGDTVLLIQMKGADIDTTNTPAFGTIKSYQGAGNYEFNTIKNIIGNFIELTYRIIRKYDVPDGKVQLIRVPVPCNP